MSTHEHFEREPAAIGASRADAARIIAAAIAVLEQGEALTGAIRVESFSRKIPAAFNASIGGHYRHCLDHFTGFMRGLDADEVDYDHRERNALIEGDPLFAREATRRLLAGLREISPQTLDRPVVTRCEVSYEHGESPRTQSSVGRELAYAIAHAIHHYALIGVMARLLEINLPPTFGVAPSTVAHLAASARNC